MVFHWSLSDSKSPQVSWILLSILTDLSIPADLSNAVVWMVSDLPLISKSSSHRTNPLVTVPRASIIIGVNVTFIFLSFFNSFVRSEYLSFIIIIIIPTIEESLTFCFKCCIWTFDPTQNAIQGDAPEGSDTF